VTTQLQLVVVVVIIIIIIIKSFHTDLVDFV
jgi:hypothetical protein